MRSAFTPARLLQDTMEDVQDDFPNVLNVFYLTSRSTDDALAESVSGEIFLFITTCEQKLTFASPLFLRQ